MFRVIFAGLGLSLASSAMAFEPASFEQFSSLVGASSAWTNDKGSTMVISLDSNGGVTGQYVNRAKGTGCQNSPYPIAGRVTGNFIAFSVGWNNGLENCHSATGWTGYAAKSSSGALQIVTEWNLAYQGGSGPAVTNGKDLFIYTEPKKGDAPIKD
ncbi:hypothetical protein Amn_pc00690 (plasmid) [Aminobacter sp. Y103A]|uniref:avidin/streptavidin family protein n=1 Tax=Phyllobacteriaceae TaxID=69277 RepID=UPI0018EBBD6F|nr:MULTISPECIES: avidin/streptavidin family protein [Phyllobacteriaceae]BBD41354.1 hypothetical protein Amn_pc00690 [Aminobacter sp. SS-2016]BCH20074.1 hypothetical protein MesoLjLa_69250 [Mesorhizobium sp. L-2-11]